jgi:hypothetical protein
MLCCMHAVPCCTPTSGAVVPPAVIQVRMQSSARRMPVANRPSVVAGVLLVAMHALPAYGWPLQHACRMGCRLRKSACCSDTSVG